MVAGLPYHLCMMSNPAPGFAAALDADRFDALLALLAPYCTYVTGADILTGRDAIIDSYRSNSQAVRAVFQSIAYRSEIIASTASVATIRFTDHVAHQGLEHSYHCQQHLTWDDSGRIIRIEHEELPGERERLRAFCERCGVVWPPAGSNPSESRLE
jgi:hypothetical protein